MSLLLTLQHPGILLQYKSRDLFIITVIINHRTDVSLALKNLHLATIKYRLFVSFDPNIVFFAHKPQNIL